MEKNFHSKQFKKPSTPLYVVLVDGRTSQEEYTVIESVKQKNQFIKLNRLYFKSRKMQRPFRENFSIRLTEKS